MRLAIFDCDGTLVDSGATIHRAVALTLAEHGLDCPPRSVTRRVIGLSLEPAMAQLVPDGDHEALAATYRQSFHDLRGAGQVDEPLYAGIAQLIDALDADGWLLGVATGKSDRGLAHVIETNHLAGRFVTLQTADRHPSKPHPAMALAAMAEANATPAETVLIGDTAWDMGCARRAGCGAIAAGWGYHDRALLCADPVHGFAEQPGEVLALAQSWVRSEK